MYSMVGLKDYEGYNLGGFSNGIGAGGGGQISAAELADLNKALTVGNQSPRMVGGAPLQAQSLETTLRYLTFTTEHIQLWKDLPKTPAFSTNVEFTVATNYGAEVGGFVTDGDPGQVIDGNYERRNAFIKFLALQGEVVHSTLLTRPAHGDVMAIKTREVTTALLKILEQALFFARQDINPQAFDGFDQILRKDSLLGDANPNTPNILDLRGGPLTTDYVEAAQNTIVEATGRGSVLYMASKALSSISTQYQQKERVPLPTASEGYAVGTPVKQYNSSGGPIYFKTNYFLRSGKVNGKKLAPTSASSTRAPTAPTLAVAPSTPASPSLFVAADAGAWNYVATAVNNWGESAKSASIAQTLVAAGDIFTATVTDGGGSFPATGYNLYRVKTAGAGAGKEEFLYSVVRVGAAATSVFIDTNRYLPGTSRAYLFQMNTEAVNIYQLAPMMKIAMATQALSVRWAQCIYLVPVLYALGRLVIFDNVFDD